ncbi:MAG: hypothetical protein OEZ10_10680 [Gammaproteobacteria bacterium]|nr:hypothetical protein [Gammaproteobacteria bacterium]
MKSHKFWQGMALACLSLFLTACPDSSSDSDGGTPHTLAGSWGGTIKDSTAAPLPLQITIDNSGKITNITVDGANTGLSSIASVTAEGNNIYGFELNDGTIGGFIVDSSGQHAGFLDDGFTFGVVQKGAPGPAGGGYVNTDIIGSWSGYGVTIDSAFNITNVFNSTGTVASNFSFSGNGLNGTFTGNFASFYSTNGVYLGTWSDTSGSGDLQAFLSADKTFAATWACDWTYGFPDGCSFSAWNR